MKFTHHNLRRLLLLTFAGVTLPCLTVGLLTPARARDRRVQLVERTAPADARVIVSACTLSGSFTVRSWNRNEVRVRSDSADVELARLDQTKSEQATELRVVSKGRRSTSRNSCLMFGGLEIDVPRGAQVRLQTTSGDISVTDLARAQVTTTSGSINLTKMSEETSATVIGGDISVRDSAGLFRLTATGGSIDARDLTPVAESDTVSASTVSGVVTLHHVTHQRVRLNSVSGEVVYSGGLLRNASYSFTNLSGEVRLLLPANSSFRVLADLGDSVKISGDFELKDTQRRDVIGRGGSRRINATVGGGDATIRISLMSGSLQIRKQ